MWTQNPDSSALRGVPWDLPAGGGRKIFRTKRKFFWFVLTLLGGGICEIYPFIYLIWLSEVILLNTKTGKSKARGGGDMSLPPSPTVRFCLHFYLTYLTKKVLDILFVQLKRGWRCEEKHNKYSFFTRKLWKFYFLRVTEVNLAFKHPNGKFD